MNKITLDKLSFMLSSYATYVNFNEILYNFIISVLIAIILIYMYNNYITCAVLSFYVLCGLFFITDKYHSGQFIGSHILLSTIFISLMYTINYFFNN